MGGKAFINIKGAVSAIDTSITNKFAIIDGNKKQSYKADSIVVAPQAIVCDPLLKVGMVGKEKLNFEIVTWIYGVYYPCGVKIYPIPELAGYSKFLAFSLDHDAKSYTELISALTRNEIGAKTFIDLFFQKLEAR